MNAGFKLLEERGDEQPVLGAIAKGGLCSSAFFVASSMAVGTGLVVPIVVGIVAEMVTRRLLDGVAEVIADDIAQRLEDAFPAYRAALESCPQL